MKKAKELLKFVGHGGSFPVRNDTSSASIYSHSSANFTSPTKKNVQISTKVEYYQTDTQLHAFHA